MDKYKGFGIARGNKLWEGNRMILPEHRKYMLELEIQRERFVERPELDEDKLMEMNQLVQAAMNDQRLITLKLYDPSGLRDVNMMPTRLERDRLKGYNLAGKLIAVDLGEIVDVLEVE